MLNLDSELLFSGDGGTTEPSRESHRRGIELAAYYAAVRRPHNSTYSRSARRSDNMQPCASHFACGHLRFGHSRLATFSTSRIPREEWSGARTERTQALCADHCGYADPVYKDCLNTRVQSTGQNGRLRVRLPVREKHKQRTEAKATFRNGTLLPSASPRSPIAKSCATGFPLPSIEFRKSVSILHIVHVPLNIQGQ